jgi:hypothetical protein
LLACLLWSFCLLAASPLSLRFDFDIRTVLP